jgi:uncharacterized protein YyaL (SSP411 family)
LFAVRERRPRPARDEKKLAAWNGLMLRAASLAARAFGRPADTELAIANAEFLHRVLTGPDGRVMRTHTDGVTKIPGFLDDHAAVALGLLATYELTFERKWLDRARAIGDAIGTWFWDDDAQAFFDTASDAEPLITRPRDITDHAIPSGTSLAVELYLRLAELFEDRLLHARAMRVLEAVADPMARYPTDFGHMLSSADLAVHGAVTLVVVGDSRNAAFRRLAAAAAPLYIPSLILAGGPAADAAHFPMLSERVSGGRGPATAYVCHDHVCDLPQTDASSLAARLAGVGRVVDRSHI